MVAFRGVIILVQLYLAVSVLGDAALTAPLATNASLPTTSQIISFVPAVVLDNDDDLNTATGSCAKVANTACKDVEAGEGRVADCISDLIAEQETQQASGGTATVLVPDACIEEVLQYRIDRSTSINKNLPLARACKDDAIKHCNNGANAADLIIPCLRGRKNSLQAACKRQLFNYNLAVARDYRADPNIYKACKADAEKLCSNIQHGGGRVQACLLDERTSLDWDCLDAITPLQESGEQDIRFAVRLFNKCFGDKKKFCADIQPGHALAKECLERHRNDEGFSPECKEEVDAMLLRRVKDFRVDKRVMAVCAEDIINLCNVDDSELEDVQKQDTVRLSSCLQDMAEMISNTTCKTLVHDYQKLAAEDIRFDVPLAEACYEDRVKFCGSIKPGSARVIRCLSNQRDKLSDACRARLFDEEVRFSANIDFQVPMQNKCAKEMERFCNGVAHGDARVIRCLQDSKSKPDFGAACRKEVEAYEAKAAQDYRFNHRLTSACEKDIAAVCRDACAATQGNLCGGTMLRCLTVNKELLNGTECIKEVEYFTKMEVTDFHNDVILAAACRDDVDKFCKGEQAGEGRIHACLRANREQLTASCRSEELLLEQQEADNLELRPSLLKACATERATFCNDVQTGQARVFRCLADNMGDPDFGDKCKTEIGIKLQRRQANWKLDPPLRKACRSDVSSWCSSEDKAGSEQGLVTKCLISHTDDLEPGCRKEVGRAVHMAFFAWSPGAPLTAPCDEDIGKLCLKGRPSLDRKPGAIGTCLATILEEMAAAAGRAAADTRKGLRDPAVTTAAAPPGLARTLSPTCATLADVAEPPNMNRQFDASLLTAALVSKLKTLGDGTGLEMVKKGRRGSQNITLTGWTAILGVCAMGLVMMWGGAYAVRRWRGTPDSQGYTLVLKNQGKNQAATSWKFW